jgi:hypothetical protein
VSSPLTKEHTEQLAAALERVGAIRKATRLATGSGWMLGISAAITAAFAAGSPTALVLMLALGGLSWNEFRGRNLLLVFDEKGADILWKNQIGLMAVLVIYCLLAIRSAGSGEVDPAMAELAVLAPDLVDLMTSLTMMVLQGVILLTVVLQGAMARFYHTRIALIRTFHASTPPWAAEVVLMMSSPAPKD